MRVIEDVRHDQPQEPVQTVSRLAIAPGSGVLGEAIAVELFNSGLTVVDANEASTIIGRAGLREFKSTSARVTPRCAKLESEVVGLRICRQSRHTQSARFV